MSPAQALAALQAILSSDTETPEDGFMTTEQWAVAWGKSWATANRLIRAGEKQGAVEMREYRISAGKRKVPHYRVKA